MSIEEIKIDKDAAEAEFERFANAMDIDIDISKLDPEDTTAFNKSKDRIILAIQETHLVINDDGEAVYTPHRSNLGKILNAYFVTSKSLSVGVTMAFPSKKKILLTFGPYCLFAISKSFLTSKSSLTIKCFLRFDMQKSHLKVHPSVN